MNFRVTFALAGFYQRKDKSILQILLEGCHCQSYLQVLFPLLRKLPLQVSHVVVFKVLDFAPRGTQSLLDREAHALIATGGGVYV